MDGAVCKNTGHSGADIAGLYYQLKKTIKYTTKANLASYSTAAFDKIQEDS